MVSVYIYKREAWQNCKDLDSQEHSAQNCKNLDSQEHSAQNFKDLDSQEHNEGCYPITKPAGKVTWLIITD